MKRRKVVIATIILMVIALLLLATCAGGEVMNVMVPGVPSPVPSVCLITNSPPCYGIQEGWMVMKWLR